MEKVGEPCLRWLSKLSPESQTASYWMFKAPTQGVEASISFVMSKCTSVGIIKAFWIEPMIWNFLEAGERQKGVGWGKLLAVDFRR